MEAGLFGGPDKNRVYELSNTTVENLQMACSVLTIESSQSILSTQSQEFAALQEHTAHLTEKYERISADYEELRQVVMDMRSQMRSTCAFSFWPYGPRNNQPPPPTPSLF
jgi:molecular chaperone GrpE (heat shock protein)